MHNPLHGYVGCFSKNDEKEAVYMQKRNNPEYGLRLFAP